MDKSTIEEQPNQTLAKALEVLDAFSADHPERGVRELGRELGINATTIFRILTTLANAGYLERNSIRQTYSLGPKVMKLASLYTHQNPLPAVARKVFDSFSDRFEHNIYLGTLHRFEVIYLAVLDGRGPIKITIDPGGTITIHSSALGKLLLAYKDEKFIQDYLKKDRFQLFTPHTLATREAVLAQLQEIRAQGYSINEGETYEDIGAVAVPVYGPKGPVNLAVSLTYPRHLITEKRINIPELIELGHEIASEISNRYNVSSWQ